MENDSFCGISGLTHISLAVVLASTCRTKSGSHNKVANDLRFTVVTEDEIQDQLRVNWEGLVLVGLSVSFSSSSKGPFGESIGV